MLPWTQLIIESKSLEFGISSGPYCCLECSWFVNPSVLGLAYCQAHITLGSANCQTQVYWVLQVARATSSWVFSSNKNINKKILTYHNQSFSSRCFFFLLWCFYSCTICLNNFFSYNKRYYKNFMNFFFKELYWKENSTLLHYNSVSIQS